MTFAPTGEQQAIIDAFKTGDDLVIEAGAGAGKTTTLRLVAEDNPKKSCAYLAYNRAIAGDAKGSFPSTTDCRTAHSFAFRAVGYRYKDRLDAPRMPGRILAELLGIEQPLVLNEMKGHVLNPVKIARIVMDTVLRYCHSAAEEMGEQHVATSDVIGLDEGGRNRIVSEALPLARKVWDDIVDIEGKLPFSHDHYLKLWQLSHPRLPFDYILFDEAQDADPCIAAVVDEQDVQVALVGDANQAIYSWRGAVDAMKGFAGNRLFLSQSFRFGEAIADEANKWLDLLDADLRIKGLDSISSRLEDLVAPAAILTRTNAGAVVEAMNYIAQGKRTAIVGGGQAVRALAEASLSLQRGQGTAHPQLFLFKTWEELREYVENDQGGTDLRVFVKMIDQFGADNLIRTIDQLCGEDFAEVVVSTAHKAKGREWDTVLISQDFKATKDIGGSGLARGELMLNYVGVTRAKKILDRKGLEWVDELLEEIVPQEYFLRA